MSENDRDLIDHVEKRNSCLTVTLFNGLAGYMSVQPQDKVNWCRYLPLNICIHYSAPYSNEL